MGTTGAKTIQSRNLVNTFQCNWLDYFQLQAQVQKRGRRCQPSSAARSKNTFPWGRDVGKNGCVGRADAQRAAPSTVCSVTPWKQLCWLPAPGGCWAGSPGQCSDAHLAWQWCWIEIPRPPSGFPLPLRKAQRKKGILLCLWKEKFVLSGSFKLCRQCCRVHWPQPVLHMTNVPKLPSPSAARLGTRCCLF